ASISPAGRKDRVKVTFPRSPPVPRERKNVPLPPCTPSTRESILINFLPAGVAPSGDPSDMTAKMPIAATANTLRFMLLTIQTDLQPKVHGRPPGPRH